MGSVYESLLELVPTLDLPGRVFGFAGITDAASSSGNARKTTGSYYTPDILVQELIKSALDPVIAQKLADHPGNPIDALLSITVCDPSCGSGHFLLAAARRLAEKLAELRAPDGAVHPDDYRHALREVIARCIHGVDRNPLALELARTVLWLEGVDPGMPLSFLEHHLICGDALLGLTDLRQLENGIPDAAFTALSGDDKKLCSELKKQNKAARKQLDDLRKGQDLLSQDYFEVVLPLLLRMAPEGLERARLFYAIELLTDPAKRTKAARSLGDAGTQWAQTFRETYHLADAGKALITEVTKGRIRGVERMHLEPGAAVTTSNPWLCVDAFLALRLAVEAEAVAAQASEKAQHAVAEQIIKLAQVA